MTVGAAAGSAATRLVGAARAKAWRGPDPYDALMTPWPAPLVGGRRRRQAIIQLHARSPVDVRRLYRRRHPRIVKALALFGAAARTLDALEPDPRMREAAADALGTILREGDGGQGWGYPFDVQTRWSFYPAGTPNVIVTSFAGLALHDAGHERPELAQAARRAAGWVLEALHVGDGGFFAYHPGSRSLIHNANVLGARLVGSVLGPAQDAVRRAVELTLDAQQPDGAFPYGEGEGLGFVDSFHTGFVLEALLALADVDPAVRPAVHRGAEHYATRFFGPRGEAWLWPGRPFPEDAHAAGTALTTLAALHRQGLADADLLVRVARRTVTHVVDGDTTVFRRHRRHRTHVSYLRWCDAHVAHGLAAAATALSAR